MANWKTERREPGTSGARYAVVEGTRIEDWGIVINMPYGPFAMGAVCALVCTANISQEEAEERADLIAAAPELMSAALEAVLQIEYLHSKFEKTGTGEKVLSVLRSALAKAGVTNA